MKITSLLILVVTILFSGCKSIVRKPIPDKLVVLTFDDASVSHCSFVAPLLKEYGFGGTFYISEFPPHFGDTTKYMTWLQIAALNKMGFEIGNHTQSHPNIAKLSPEERLKQVEFINNKCIEFGVDEPTTFAYPGYRRDEKSVEFLKEYGFKFARIGENRVYNPKMDHPLLVPSWGMGANNTIEIMAAFQEAKEGSIVVLTIHGVPDTAHPFVCTPPELFKTLLQYLSDNNFTVVAFRDIEEYVNVKNAMKQITYSKELANFP